MFLKIHKVKMSEKIQIKLTRIFNRITILTMFFFKLNNYYTL